MIELINVWSACYATYIYSILKRYIDFFIPSMILLLLAILKLAIDSLIFWKYFSKDFV